MVVPLCVSEMQKTEYMVFAGRQYFLGDKCQVQKPQKLPNDTQPSGASDWLIQPQLCFRCVWSPKGSTTTPSSRKWEHTRLPSPCSSRSWERSNTHAGRPCVVTVLSRCCHGVPLCVCQTPGSSN